MIKLLNFLDIKSLKTLKIFINGIKSALFYGMVILIAFTFLYHWAVVVAALFGVFFGIVSDINQEFAKKSNKAFLYSIFSGIPFYAIIIFTIMSAEISFFCAVLVVFCFCLSVLIKYMSKKLGRMLNFIIKETTSIKKRVQEKTINYEVANVLIKNQTEKLKESTGLIKQLLVTFVYLEIIILSSLLIYVFYSTNISGRMIFFSILIFFVILAINYFLSEISKLIINKQI